MRQFYVYGFRSRSEMGMKSPRSYDNEPRDERELLIRILSFGSMLKVVEPDSVVP